MIPFIIFFGAITFLVGIIILVNPEMIFGPLRKNSDKIELHILAVVIRLILGAFLLYSADASKYPLAIEIIGWLSIIAAVFLAVIGRKNFSKLMAWALSLMKPVSRVGGILAVAFGLFIVYAFV